MNENRPNLHVINDVLLQRTLTYLSRLPYNEVAELMLGFKESLQHGKLPEDMTGALYESLKPKDNNDDEKLPDA